MVRTVSVRRKSQRSTGAVAVLALVAALLAPARPTAATAAAAPQIDWVACRDGFQCASVQVPLDHDRPDEAKISLALIRLPAASPSRRIGSVFVNPGGPGGSGVDLVRGVAKYVPLELRARFDIVGFDPRGVARSTPLRCFRTFDELISILPPFAFPLTPEEEDIQRASDEALASACDSRGGPLLDHMATADVARDLDLLRQAVGDEKLNYLGYSYGSYLGTTYANLFPDRTRALVVDAVLDPIAWSTGRGTQARTLPFSTRLKSDVGAQRTLLEFFRLCDAAGADCAFSGDARQRYAALARSLREDPIEIVLPGGETFLFTYADLIGVTFGALYAAFIWPDLAEFLAAIEAEASAPAVGQRLAALRAGLGLDAEQEPYPNFIEAFYGVSCSDSENPDTFDAWQTAADQTEHEHGYFGRLVTWRSSPCLPWPGADQDRYLGPWNARTASPVLVVGNFFDPATRYLGAVTLSKLLPNSRLLSYAGWGHAAFLAAGNFCVNSAVVNYLLTTQVPPAGTVCQPEGSPFGPLEAAAAARAAGGGAIQAATLPEAVRRALRAR